MKRTMETIRNYDRQQIEIRVLPTYLGPKTDPIHVASVLVTERWSSKVGAAVYVYSSARISSKGDGFLGLFSCL